MTGRPSSFTQAIADEICERLIEGESLRAICDLPKMPAKATVLMWAHRDEHGFRDQYARARLISAESDADDVSDIARKIVTGEIEPAAGTAAINGYKWSAGKRAPKLFGDKVALTGPDGDGPVEIKMIERVVVDATPK